METEVKIRNKGTRDEELIISSNRVTVSCSDAYNSFAVTVESVDDEVTFATNSPSDIYEIIDCLNIAMSQYERKRADDERIKQLKAQIKVLEAEIGKIENGVDKWSAL